MPNQFPPHLCECGLCLKCRHKRARAKWYAKKGRAYHRRWKQKNRARVTYRSLNRDSRRAGYAGICLSIEAFEQWYAKHLEIAAGRCEWCRIPTSSFYTDHDHETGMPRALVCKSCNLLEGNARSPEQLIRVAAAKQAHLAGVDWRHEETLESMC